MGCILVRRCVVLVPSHASSRSLTRAHRCNVPIPSWSCPLLVHSPYSPPVDLCRRDLGHLVPPSAEHSSCDTRRVHRARVLCEAQGRRPSQAAQQARSAGEAPHRAKPSVSDLACYHTGHLSPEKRHLEVRVLLRFLSSYVRGSMVVLFLSLCFHTHIHVRLSYYSHLRFVRSHAMHPIMHNDPIAHVPRIMDISHVLRFRFRSRSHPHSHPPAIVLLCTRNACLPSFLPSVRQLDRAFHTRSPMHMCCLFRPWGLLILSLLTEVYVYHLGFRC